MGTLLSSLEQSTREKYREFKENIKMPNVRLGDIVPDFSADTDKGPMKFHEWLGGSWGILFSHPADYTPVCTTELGRVQQLYKEFEKRGCKVAALSIDTAESHKGWIGDIKDYNKLGSFDCPSPAVRCSSLAPTRSLSCPSCT